MEANEKNYDLDPKTDWVFKLIFTEDGERSKKALLSFLNAMLEEKYGQIQSADILDSELTKKANDAKTYHLDILIKTDNNLFINLEMQNFPKKYFIWRSQSYLFEMMRQMIFFDSSQELAEQERNTNFAVSLSVCNFKLKEHEKQKIIPENAFMDFIYLEIPEIIAYTKNKSLEELSKKELWCRFLAYIPEDKTDGTLEKLSNLDEGIQMAQKTMVKVTQREREAARYLAEYKYNLILQCERAEARDEQRELDQKEINDAKAETDRVKEENARLKAELEALKNNLLSFADLGTQRRP